jgi:clan AA aspartic protease (TIGR02281 family)
MGPREISWMPRLFTVRWPFFARLEAILLFPVALMLAYQIAPVRSLIDTGLVPALSPLHVQLDVPYAQIIWFAAGLATFGPYVFALIVVDRILTVRKGYAAVSLITIAFWATAGLELCGPLADYLPRRPFGETNWLTFEQQVGLAAGGVAVLLHAWPLWIGLRDDGDVAARLVAGGEEYGFERAHRTSRHGQDIYYRQTAVFREWRPQRQLDGLGGEPREHTAIKVLSAVTWIGVVVAVGAAYHNWSSISGKTTPAPPAPMARVQSGVVSVAAPTPPHAPVTQSRTPSAVPDVVAIPPLPSVTQSRAGAVPVVIAIPPLPSVQRPSDYSSNIQGSGGYVGSNEAVAERGGDGSFAFDVIVNGAHVPMLFDTGASVVAIRSEDAGRLGIALAKLNYSAKVKTANGTAEVAPIIIDTLTVGNITQRAVPGFVAKQGVLQSNLLGQSFLTRLAGYNVEKNLLLLKGR